MATYVQTLKEFNELIGKDKLTVVDFTATWCGPCKNIAPFYDGLAAKYPDVAFLKVDVDQAQEIAGAQGVRAMPTFKFFCKGEELETLQGANPSKLEELVLKHKSAAAPAASAFGGQGHTMGTAGSAADAAAARLARFGGPTPAPAPAAASGKASNAGNAAEEDEDEALAKAIAMSMEQDSSSSALATADSTAAEGKDNGGEKTDAKDTKDTAETDDGGDPNELVPLPVSEDLLKEMLAMGFSDIRARKGLHFGGNVDGAVNWIEDNKEQANIDDEFLVRRGDINKKPLTPEETAIKMQEYKLLAQRRRVERAEQEKKEEIHREKERRERDQKSQVTQAERETMQRKREAEKIRKEKMDAKAEKTRILAEIARDKEVRSKNKGVLPSVLGVDGYNPSAIQYEQDGPGGKNGGLPKSPDAESSTAPVTAPAALTTDEMVDKSISNLLRYKTRGDGGNALKLLGLFVKNVAEKPTEVKYRSISTESNAYKTKVAPFVGGASLLKALGFLKNEEGKLVLNVPEEDTTSFVPLFVATLTKLNAAANVFASENPV